MTLHGRIIVAKEVIKKLYGMITKIKLGKRNFPGVSRKWIFTITLGLLAVGMASAQNHPVGGTQVYIAKINAINPQLTNSEFLGQAIFIIANGQFKISLVVNGLSPGMDLQKQLR